MAQILIFGDSITDGSTDTEGGWADRLKRFLWEKNVKGEVIHDEYYWLYNLGISGNTTADVLKRIDVESTARKVERRRKGIVFVFAIGINDTVLLGRKDPNPVMSEAEFRKNNQKLIDFAKQYTDKVLWVGLTPVDEKRTCPIYDDYWYKNSRIKEFNTIAKEVARNSTVEFLELQEPFMKINNYETLLDDGLHPNDEGHRWMYEHIKPHVLELLESLK